MAGKDIVSNRLLTEEDILQMQVDFKGRFLGMGERNILIVLLDISARLKEQNELLAKFSTVKDNTPELQEPKQKAERPKLA